jgi:hypothetical protein
MPRRDGEVFLFGTAMGENLLELGAQGAPKAKILREAGLIEEGSRQG